MAKKHAAMQSEDESILAQVPSNKMAEFVAGLAKLAEKNRRQSLMGNDPIVQSIQKRGFPVTQENYLALAYPGEEMTPELMASLGWASFSMFSSFCADRKVRMRLATSGSPFSMAHFAAS